MYKQREHAEVVRILTSPLAKNGGLTASLYFAVGLSLFELKQYLDAAASRAFVQWYQRLIAFGATETLQRVNTNLDAFRESLPTAAQLLNCALSEAREPAAAGRAP